MMGVVQQYSNNISWSERAKQQFLVYPEASTVSPGVRLSLKKTGCSGFAYVLEYEFEPKIDDIIFPLHAAYQVYVDKASYAALKGLYIDYVQQGLNFKMVFQNPNQTGQCGCGESFSLD